jgi:methyl-accepting chemotaxis protein
MKKGAQMKKISNKIVAAIMVCVVAGTLIVGYISAISAREAISEQVNQNMQSLSAQYAYEMETSLAHYEGIAQTIGTYIGATLSYSKAKNVTMSVGYFQELDRYLQEVSIQNPDLLSVSAFVNPDLAKVIFGSWFKGVDKVDYDPYDAYTEYSNGEEAWKWHQEILQRGEPLWSEPYFNQRFQEEIISYYYPIIDKEEEVIIAIVGVDIPFEEFRNMGTAISDKEPGGTMLIDQSNRIIVGSGHPQGTSLKDGGYGELEEALIQQGSGFRSMEVEGHGSCFVGFERLKSGFTFVVYSPQSQAFTSVRNTTFTIAVVSAGVIVLAMILAVVVGNSISKPIYLVIEDLLLMESGNFTGVKHRKCLKNKDETGKLAKALEVIQISMGEMVGIVNENSSVVAELVRKLEKIVERLMDRVSDVTQVSQELSAGMEQTSATAQNLSNTSEYMKQHMEAMKEKNEEGTASVNGIAQRAGILNEEFNEDAKSAKELTKDVVIDLQASIEESKKVEQIKMLTEGILKIANETNLLSLNASIEAARAGIHGSGFGVVAKEISRMAEESRYTAQRIQNITMEVIDAVERLSQSSEKAMNFINGYIIDGYGKMMEVSEQYRMDSLDIKEIFVGFSAVSNDILNETEILNQAFYELKRTTSDGTRGTGELLGNADQMSEITELVQKQSKELAEVFAKLKKAIGKFTI